MRRVLRHFFTVCSALSLLLCIAVCGLWVRSYWAVDSVWFDDRLPDGRRTYAADHVYSARGGITLELLDRDWKTYSGREGWTVGGFGMYREQAGDRREPIFWYYEVPHWSIALVSAILPAVWLWRWRRFVTARAMTGRCPACGYDLRASPERCPECGTATAISTDSE